MITPVGSGKRSRSAKSFTGPRHPLAYAIATVLAFAAWPALAGNTTAPALSQGWLNQAQTQAGTQANGGTPSSLSSLTAQTPAQLLQQRNIQQSLANLSRAAQAVAAQMSAQQAAQQAAQQLTSPVPNGLTPGGLVVAPGAAGNPNLWLNANAPTQSTSNGQTTVAIKQTAQKAILSWSSFNVGRNTTVYFDQSGGNQTNGSNNNWIALNRVTDPSGVPSQIFGQIKAEGTVYILNHNGILFGAGSQVNTNSLIASSLDLFSSDVATSNSQFLNGGIAPGTSANLPFLVNGSFTDGKNHDVVVQNGASINGGTQGFVLLAAPNVSNAGSIVDDQGQVILAAGTQFENATSQSTTLPLSVLNAGGDGNATNTGLLQSRRGEVEMDGYNVTQDGVALASTSISYPGSVLLNAQDEGASGTYQRAGALVLGPNAVTAVLPEEDGTTTTSTAQATAAFTPSSLTLSGKTVTFQAGSLLEAPNAKLNINAVLDSSSDYTDPLAGRIYVDNGVVIDVSGLADVELPISALLVTIPRVGQNELANSPLLRNSFLYTQKNVVVDSTQSGIADSGLTWIGSPILNASGYVDDIPRSIDQMMTNGGSINLAGNQVIVRSGAQVNLDGGYIAYQAGWITTPNLLAANGRVYNIANADPNQIYVGFAGEYSVVDNRWGVSTTYSNPLLAGSTRWDNGFAVGGNAGTLNISTGTALALDGQISAQAFAGRNQVAQGNQPSGGTLDISVGGGTNIAGVTVLPNILLEQSVMSVQQTDPNFQADTSWSTVLGDNDPAGTGPYDLSRWVPVSANLVQQGGFSTLDLKSIGGEILEPASTVLNVQPGGSIQFTASGIHILGELNAPAGSIAMTVSGDGSFIDPTSPSGATLPGNIVIDNGAVLSTAGLWVNDSGASADDYLGERYINGGSISLTIDQADVFSESADHSSFTYTDETGSILLQAGSLLDVSSGGYVNNKGVLQLVNGVPVGNSGNISLITYADQGSFTFNGSNATPPASLGQGTLVLDGTLRAYGFSSGGTLTLQAADLQIGGSASDLALSNGVYLAPSFFAGQGFDNYVLNSVTDANIGPGAIVQVSRDNLLPNAPALLAAPTGTDIYGQSALTQSAYTSVGQLAPYLRYITRDSTGTGFSLNAGQYLSWASAAFPGALPENYPGVTGSVTMGAGAMISADAGATVTLAGVRSTVVDGTIDAPGGTINITNPATNGIGTGIVGVAEVWLEPQAVLNAAGVSLINPLAAAEPGGSLGPGLAEHYTPRTGLVLDGGSVNVTSSQGYVLTEQGSVIDVAGASDVYDLPVAGGALNGAATGYIPTPVWSNGGSIVLGADAGLYADGTLLAQPGNAQAEGGSLQITGMANGGNPYTPTATAIVLQQSGLLVPASGLQPGDTVTKSAATGVLYFALDRLDNSGISSLAIGPDASVSNTTTHFTALPVGFAGNIDLALSKSFEVDANTLTALPAGSKDLSGLKPTAYNPGGGTVQISAPYVEITGLEGNSAAQQAAMSGSGTLNINADFIDLGGWMNLQGWSNANFTASGDIRFYVPTNLQYPGGTMLPGLLLSGGNLTFQATELYPITNYSYVIEADSAGLTNAQGSALSTTLTILGNGGTPSVPLSAGGGLLLDADNIVQDGAVWAPSGNLVLGVQTPSSTLAAFGLSSLSIYPLIATKSVTLGAGSLTSVSLAGATVPYGSTTDGLQWSYAGNANVPVAPLAAPPSKSITIAGADVSLDSGATIDIRGGGQLQASEWVPGVGGTVNVLTQYETSYANSTTGTQIPQYADGRAIYAILPGYTAPVSAQDAAMNSAVGAGAGPAVGQSVYLSGIAGLPAGYYTLLPAGYATLPGAYRVVQNTSSQNSVLGQNAVLPDGTLSVTGYFANALDGSHQSTNTTFLVQSAPVWQQYSQYTFTDADTYFASQAASNGTVTPLLPVDGGHLLLSANQQLQLGATLQDAPATGGRSGMVDIAAQAIQVTGANSTSLGGNYLQISADQLTALNAGSLLLGGSRQLTADGYQVTSTADSVVLSNDSADPLQGQEILLVANGNGDSNGLGGVVLQSGSYIAATGAGTPNATPLVFGVNGDTGTAISGNGALLRVSQDGVAAVVRNDTSGTTQGNLTVAAGATVQGGGSLTMDTTGVTTVDPNAVFAAQNIQATANQISFVGSDAAAGANAGGLQIGPGTLSLFDDASQVTLSSRGDIDFLGNVSIDLPQALDLNASAYVSDGGNVTIKAATLGLGNAAGTGTAAAATGAGQLTLNAGELDFTAGSSVTQGFASVTANASQGIVGQGNGSVDFGAANITFNTPIMLAQSGGDTTLTTSGSFAINHAAGTALADGNIGGALALSGGTLTVGTQVDALAGNLKLTATGGDLLLADGANVDVAGVNETLYDVTVYAPGGSLALTSNTGSVIVDTGAVVNFAGASLGGTAGSVAIAADQLATLDGSFEGGALSGYKGGYFSLSSGGALDLDQLAQLTRSAGTTSGIAITSGTGNLVLSAGQSLVAQDVSLTANDNAGMVDIEGTVNVSGDAAGAIQLYGHNGVTVNGSLLATSSVPGQFGGIVQIGTTGTPDGQLDPTYGYEEVQPGSAGSIVFGPNAIVDVAGGSAGVGGTISLRAPLLANGDVPIDFANTASISGANRVTIVPYAVWSTADTANQGTAKYFDGVIDPAGWYQPEASGAPQMVAGTWYNAAGVVQPAPTAATLQSYLSEFYFVPDAADALHQTFYGYVNGDPSQGAGTLMSYVQQPGYSFGNRYAGIANLQISPGIELVNPQAGVNGGDISVLTNWNLGAGVTAQDGTIQLAYRYGANPAVSASGIAPTLTVLALHDLNVDASITDGFYQQNNGASIVVPVNQPSGGGVDPAYTNDLNLYDATIDFLENDNYEVQNGFGPYNLWNGGVTFFWFPGGGFNSSPASIVGMSQPDFYQPITAPQPGQSSQYYNSYQAYIQTVGAGQDGTWSAAFNSGDIAGFLPFNLSTITAPTIGADYAAYVGSYQQWLTSNFNSSNDDADFSLTLAQIQTPPPLLAPLNAEAAGNYTQYSTDYGTYITGFNAYYKYVSTNLGSVGSGEDNFNNFVPGSQFFYAPAAPFTGTAVIPQTANNSPSNMPSLGNPASLASATLLGGSSSNYQLVAGANFSSANPLSVVSGTSAGNVNFDGHFAVDYTAAGGNGNTLEFPTVVRTGTGSIQIVAAGDIDWQDATAPAAIYTGGAPAAGTTAGTGVTASVPATEEGAVPDLLINGQVNPDNAGNILLSAGGNINGIEQVYDSSGTITGTPGALISQFWWPWMETGNSATGSSINFANFDQGVMSVGGNVTVNAGGNISDLSVSLPTTWYANAADTAITTVGGGNLAVTAGGNILSGSYFVANGTGSLTAGGQIGSDFTYALPQNSTGPGGISLKDLSTPVSTLLALQNGQWQVQARTGVDIADILNPSYAAPNGLNPDDQSYSASSAVNVTTAAGDVTLGSLAWETQLLGVDSPTYELGILPSTLDFAALSGNINILTAGGLYPSATGNLSLLAGNSVQFAQQNYDLDIPGGIADGFGLIDADASVLPSPLLPQGSAAAAGGYSQMAFFHFLDSGATASTYAQVLHQAGLHDTDSTPVRIYALSGSIIDGTPAPNGTQMDEVLIEPDKPALIYAGQDIVDLSFIGQQTHDADITRIAAGHDIYDTQYNPVVLATTQPNNLNYQPVPVIALSGVGTLEVQAGHNIGPLTSQSDLLNADSNIGSATGIETIGNTLNPYLPHDGASVDVLFGVGPGIQTGNFLNQYVFNPNSADGFGNLLPDLVAFMQQQEDGAVVDTGFTQDQLNVVLTTQQAEAAFQQLPSYKQGLFAQQEFFKMLAQVGTDYNDPTSPFYGQYARGYAAIASLFPASLGYTDNGSGAGGINGEAKTIDTGDLDIRSSTIQTQQGGSINILGPGGQALIGSAEAPPVIVSNGQVAAGPNTMGVLTLEQGDVNIFTDRSLLLAQSRIFTEQGGNMTIWSSNGDINAGQGAKTVAVIPAPTYLCDTDAFCLLDAKGQVSGAGIATLQTVPGAPTGNVYLVAPRGTVDAGDAGIRVSGNLVVAAAQVANADNIQVQGQKIGVPVAQSANFGALNAASSAAGAVSKVAQDMVNQQQNDALSRQPSIIAVQVLGFGDGSTSIFGGSNSYDPNSPVQVLGAGPLSDTRKKMLTEAERHQLAQ